MPTLVNNSSLLASSSTLANTTTGVLAPSLAAAASTLATPADTTPADLAAASTSTMSATPADTYGVSVTLANTADSMMPANVTSAPIPATSLWLSALDPTLDDMSELSEDDRDEEDNLKAESKGRHPSLECEKILDEGLKAINALILQIANNTG